MKSNRPLFTKPYELLITHEKNEVSMATHGSLKWIFRETVSQQNFQLLSFTVDFFVILRLLQTQSLIINFTVTETILFSTLFSTVNYIYCAGKNQSKLYDGLLMVFCWFVKSSGF